MRDPRHPWAMITLAVLVAGCAGPAGPDDKATRVVVEMHQVSSGGIGNASGNVTLVEDAGSLTIDVDVTGLGHALHGFHVHQNPSCEPANGSAAGAAGGHFNPGGVKHPQHAGDLGNIDADTTGRALRTIRESELQAPLTLRAGDPYSLRGRSFVVHENPDDLIMDPSGNSGRRILCGPFPSP